MTNIFDLPLQDLLFFVKEGCHSTMDELLDELVILISDLQMNSNESSYPKNFPVLVRNFATDIHKALRYEEKNLFPLIEAGNFGHAQASIDVAQEDHVRIKLKLEKVLEFTETHNLVESEDAGIIHILSKLHEIEVSLTNLIHIEEDILFPMTMKTYLEN